MASGQKRFVSWGHWGISFWNGDRNDQPTWQAIAEVSFPVGPQGPMDGFIGSPERQRWIDACRVWTERGELPEGAYCATDKAWLYDADYPGARWLGGQWVSPQRIGKSWVFPVHAEVA